MLPLRLNTSPTDHSHRVMCTFFLAASSMSKLEGLAAHLQELVFEKLDTTSLQRLSQTSAALKDATFQFRLHKAMDYYDDAPAAVWQNATVIMYVRSGRALVAPGRGMTWTGLLGQTFDGYKFAYRGVKCAVM